MATKTQQMPATTTTVEAPASGSCYKRKHEATKNMFEKFVDRFDVFVHASVDQHKACFKNTIRKVTEMPKAIKERLRYPKELSCKQCSIFDKS